MNLGNFIRINVRICDVSTRPSHIKGAAKKGHIFGTRKREFLPVFDYATVIYFLKKCSVEL